MRDTLTENILQVQSSYANLVDAVHIALGDDRRITAPAAIIVLCLGSQCLSPTEIIRRSYYIGTNMNYTVKMLEAEGLIKDAPCRDRRGRKLVLSEAGHELASRLRAHLTTKRMAA